MSRVKTFNRSFSGGIITAELHGRPDLEKYVTGVKDAINVLPLAHGPMKRRPGFGKVNRTKNGKARLIPFIFSADQALVLELGEGYMRMHVNGGTVLESNITITNISSSIQCEVTYSGTGPSSFKNGDWVYLASIVGTMSTINGSFWEVFDVNTTNKTFKLKDPVTGTPFDSNDYSYTSDGTFARVYEVQTPWQEEHLFNLRFDQDTDIITVSDENYASYEIQRLAATDWDLAAVTYGSVDVFPSDPRLLFANDATDPDGMETNATQAVATKYLQSYIVTAVMDDNEETLPSKYLIGNANTCFLSEDDGSGNYRIGYTTVYGDITDGDWVYFHTPDLPEIHQQYFRVADTTGDRVTLTDIDTEAYIPSADKTIIGFGSLGASNKMYRASFRSDLTTDGAYNKLSWNAVANAKYYKVYKKSNSGNVFGYVGRVDTPLFFDRNVTPDVAKTPPVETTFFQGDNHPRSVGSFEQRRVFGGTVGNHNTGYMSRSGLRNNFNQSIPLQDDDAITVKTVVGQQNAIRHVVTLNDLIFLTSGSAIRIYSTNGDPLSNENIMPRVISRGGASHTQPVMAKNAVLYVAAVGGHIHEISYLGDKGYSDIDVSVLAPDLFDEYDVADMAYSRSPVPAVWVVRSDGKLLSFTYLPEQKVTAWATHDTDNGLFESVCVIPESGQDVVYVSVKRTINGNTVRFIERMSDMFTPKTRAQSEYLDCSLKYTGAATDTITGLWEFEGEAVYVFADGAPMGEKTVSGGQITLDYEASTVLVGFNKRAGFDLLPVYLQMEAFGASYEKNLVQMWMRVSNSAGFLVGVDADDDSTMTDVEVRNDDEDWDETMSLRSGVIEAPVLGEWNSDGSVAIRINEPLPLTILSITQEVDISG